jgi:cyclic beta-1,2-glucan glucanotransferase
MPYMTLTQIHLSVVWVVVFISGLFVYSLGTAAMSTPAYWVVALCFAVLAIGPAGCLCALGSRNRLDAELTRPATPIAPEIDDIKVAIVVPAKFLSAKNVDDLLQRLLEHFLSHRGGQRYFGILSDFHDAPTQIAAGDDVLLARAVSGIEQLNARYCGKEGGRFFLLHRPRVWSPSQRQWMGYERKRGKLLTFNAYLLTGEGACYSGFAGPVGELIGARYVITLDEDNRLLESGARRLIAAMLQSEQQLQIDVTRRVVRAGHAILQPRTQTAPPRNPTRYQQLTCSGSNGVVSLDWIYLCKAGEVPFVGKGIYCVKTFQNVLAGRFPDGRILGHDILEGCYLRCGLVTDVTIAESPLSSIPLDLARLHRWMRDDYQNLPWSFSTVAEPEKGRTQNPLLALCRWRILIMATRNLAPCFMLSMIVAGMFVQDRAGYIAATAIALYATPYWIGLVRGLLSQVGPDRGWVGFRTTVSHSFPDLCRVALHVLTLPTVAWLGVDALARSLWRMYVSGSNLLQWTPSAWLALVTPRSPRIHYVVFTPNFIVGALLVWAVVRCAPAAMLTACGVATVWLCAPLVSRWLAMPRRPRVVTSAQPSCR